MPLLVIGSLLASMANNIPANPIFLQKLMSLLQIDFSFLPQLG